MAWSTGRGGYRMAGSYRAAMNGGGSSSGSLRPDSNRPLGGGDPGTGDQKYNPHIPYKCQMNPGSCKTPKK